ncbi:hypothetical protein EPN42_04655 [bacterium]|nr:MAG: hypothetical protein EPN42_04655 [bacterium]
MSVLPLFSLDDSVSSDGSPTRVSLSPEARAALGSISYASDEALLPRVSPTLYREIDDFFDAIGVTWNRKRRRHVAPADAKAAIVEAVTTGFYADTIATLEFFPTGASYAHELAQDLANEIGWMAAPRILEPSAGDGAMVGAILELIPHAQVTAVEVDPRRAKSLLRRFAGDERVRVVEESIFSHTGTAYDGALMNPPFSEALEHIRHVRLLLRAGGALVGIAPHGPTNAHIGRWLHQADALLWRTPDRAFATTTVGSLSFRLRNGYTYHQALLAELTAVPGATAALVDELEAISLALHRLAEDRCNGTTDEDQAEARILQHRTVLEAWLAPLSIGFEFAWDPRAGHGLRLHMPSGHTNDFAQTGIIVPCAYEPTRDVLN